MQFETLHERTIAPIVIFLFIAVIIGDTTALLAGFSQLQFLERVAEGSVASYQQASQYVSFYQWVSLAQLFLMLVTAIAFCIWFYGVHENLQAFEIQDLRYRPAWAVWGFIVPILNLFRPYQVAKEVWQASTPDQEVANWKESPNSRVIQGWWGFFLAANIVTYVAGLVAFQEVSLAKTRLSTWLLQLGDLLSIGAALCAIVMIRQIEKRQAQKYQVLKSLSKDRDTTKL